MKNVQVTILSMLLAAVFTAYAIYPAEAQRRHYCVRNMLTLSDAERKICDKNARASLEAHRICKKKFGARASKAKMDTCINAEFSRLMR